MRSNSTKIKFSTLAVLVLGIFSLQNALGLPTLAVPNMTINPSSATPSFVKIDKTDDADQTANQQVIQQLNSFSAQIRGKILQTQLFNLVDLDNKQLQNYMVNESDLIQQPLYAQESEPPAPVTMSESNPTSQVKNTINKPPKLTPDYILFANVSAINAGEEINPIINTNKYSAIYSIDLAVDYKLVRTRDRFIVAAFTAAGHAGDVKFVSSNAQKIYHNIPLLVQEVGSDLANEVSDRLSEQIGGGKLILNNQESAPKITDIKTYN